jgi:hydrogenase maturation protease
MKTALVVGIGHPYRGDDRVGLAAAQAVERLNLPHIRVVQHHGEGGDLMNLWDGAARLVLIDAMNSGAVAGTMRCWDLRCEDPPAQCFPKTSHVFGLAEALHMARLLGRLPRETLVIGIEAGGFEMGAEMTPAVIEIIPGAVSKVVDFVEGGR